MNVDLIINRPDGTFLLAEDTSQRNVYYQEQTSLTPPN